MVAAKYKRVSVFRGKESTHQTIRDNIRNHTISKSQSNRYERRWLHTDTATNPFDQGQRAYKKRGLMLLTQVHHLTQLSLVNETTEYLTKIILS